MDNEKPLRWQCALCKHRLTVYVAPCAKCLEKESQPLSDTPFQVATGIASDYFDPSSPEGVALVLAIEVAIIAAVVATKRAVPPKGSP